MKSEVGLVPGEQVLAQAAERPASSLSRREFLMAAAVTGAAAVASLGQSAPVSALHQREVSFDEGWRFYRGALEGAEAEDFNDADWRPLDLPHDWGIEDLPNAVAQGGLATAEPACWATPIAPERIGPFDKATGDRSQGFLLGGEGWYRKHFTLTHAHLDHETELRLDGVFQNADVWLNGKHIAFHPGGYMPVLLRLTPQARMGQNLIAVRVRNIGATSRWYPGSGIYRHTWLTITRAVRLPTFGVRITTPEVTPTRARVRVEIDAENKGTGDASAAVSVTVIDAEGRVMAHGAAAALALSAGTRSTYVVALDLPMPSLWSPDTPHLYFANIELRQGQAAVDRVTQSFGVRSIFFDARGFVLNGTALKMRGGCVHSQHGALGAASFDAAEERRVRILKEHGFNAVRTAHNPPSPAFLDACDRLGLLVYAEAFDMWDQSKRQDDYHLYFAEWYERDLDIFIARDRNHPSIVIWSTGNEIMGSSERAPELARRVRMLDPTRPVTQSAAMGMADLIEPILSGDLWSYLDVGDVHYQLAYETLHEAQPDKAMIQSESWVANCFDNWKGLEDNACAAGDFVWTAWDYLGETGVGAARVVEAGAPPLTLKNPFPHVVFPWFQAYCGDIDLIGQPKPQNLYRRVVYGDRPLEIVVQRPPPDGMEQRAHMWSWFDELQSWSWDVEPGRAMRVKIYTRGDEVFLTLNGNPVGSKRLTQGDKRIAAFDVPYSPGALTSVALVGGQEIARQTIETVGAAAGLRLTADPEPLVADRGSIAHVLVQLVDAKGRTLPDGVVQVAFDVTGEARIAAVGNANPRNVDSFRRPVHYTYHGQAQIVLRSTGRIGTARLRAQALGLQPAELSLVAGKGPVPHWVAAGGERGPGLVSKTACPSGCMRRL
jgi:beta-galactosidase